jgi:alpha-1,2-mannosyltransferase
MGSIQNANRKLSWGLNRAALVIPGLVVLLGGSYFAGRSGSDPTIYSNDFNVYYHAAREIIAGRDPYQHSLGEWTPYLYPPLLAELIIPLAVLRLPFAAYVWFLISGASVAAAAWMTARLVTESRPLNWVIVVCPVLIVFRFVLDNFDLGQVNTIVSALAVAHVFLYGRGKRTLSALALAVAVSIKLTPAVLLLYHVAKLRWRFVITCVVLLFGITVLSALPLRGGEVEAFRTFANRTVNNEQGYNLADSGNQSLRGLIARLATGEEAASGVESRSVADGITVLVSIAFLAAAVLGGLRARDELAGAAPFFCCAVLLSPLSWKAHYVALVAPLASLVGSALVATGVRRRLIGASLASVFVLFNLTSLRLIGRAAAEWADAHSLVFAGGFLVFLACVVTGMAPKFGKQPDVC